MHGDGVHVARAEGDGAGGGDDGPVLVTPVPPLPPLALTNKPLLFVPIRTSLPETIATVPEGAVMVSVVGDGHAGQDDMRGGDHPWLTTLPLSVIAGGTGGGVGVVDRTGGSDKTICADDGIWAE